MDKKWLVIKSVSIACVVATVLNGIVILLALVNALASNYLSDYIGFCTIGSILLGGYYAGFKGRTNGWLLGGCVGFIFSVLSVIASLVVIPRMLSPKELIGVFLTRTVMAGMAGVCGVNIASAKNKLGRKKQEKPMGANMG